jgi:catechol 2,3-dioxygenase-like lactoylglutathione lyase family enzyme
MLAKLTKPAINLGIITSNADALLSFYHHTLGFPIIKVINHTLSDNTLLQCGDSILTIVAMHEAPKNKPCKDGFMAACGFRYMVLEVSNVEDIVTACRTAGYKVVMDVGDWPNSKIAMVEDPDGNTIELMDRSWQPPVVTGS